MSSWHSDIFDEIEKLVKSDCTVSAGMSEIVTQCARHRPHEDWARVDALDFETDVTRLERWLRDAFATPPPEQINGLWFGLNNPVYEGVETADIYASGSPYDPQDPDWACAVAWQPPSQANARSGTLRDIFDIAYGSQGLSYGDDEITQRDERFLMNDAEYPLCLGYGALAIRWLASALEAQVLLGGAASRVLFAGFDSGDLICIGQLTSSGLDFSRDSFDYVGGSLG